MHVFLLLVYLGTSENRVLVSADMYFKNIDRCNYFASQLAKRYGNYGSIDWMDPKDRATIYCVPKYIDVQAFGGEVYD